MHTTSQKILESYALVSAWQEIPSSFFVGIVDIVRNKILKFTLEIKQELGQVGDRPSAVPPEKVQAAVVNYIYGGNNVIAGTASNINQVGNIVVGKGDIAGLLNALKTLDVSEAEIAMFKGAIEADGAIRGKSLGTRTTEWLKNAGKKIGRAGAKIGTVAAQSLMTEWLMQYYGLK